MGSLVPANKIWKALGAPDNMGISSIGGHNYCQIPVKQVEDLNAFVDKFLWGKNTNTAVFKNDAVYNFGFQEASHVDWQTPTLSQ